MTVIGIDLGGTIIKTGLIKDGRLLARDKIRAHSRIGLQPSLPAIENSIKSLLDQSPDIRKHITGIGIAFPGIVDSVQMKVLSTNKKYQDAEVIDFKLWAEQKFGYPLMMENDARLALLGEWQYGAGQGIENIVMITLGTGVGGATLIEGKLLKGKHFQAGCLGGHFIVNLNGNICSCGNIGCVEAEASSWQLVNMIQHHPHLSSSCMATKKADFESLFNCAGKGDKMSISIRDKCLEVWAAGVINQIHAYDPEMVIIGGGVMKSADVILPFIREKVEKHAWTPWGRVKVVASEIPDESALLGSYYLISKENGVR